MKAGLSTLWVDVRHLYYVFITAVEVACMSLIVWSVWTKCSSEAAVPRQEQAR